MTRRELDTIELGARVATYLALDNELHPLVRKTAIIARASVR